MAREVIITPEKTEKWIRLYLRKRLPEFEADYRKAWNAFLRCLENRSVDDKDLALIVEAAKSKRTAIWINAVEWMRQMVADHINVQNEIRKMVSDPNAHVRHSGICSIGWRTPRQFQLEILLPAINDRSSKVRFIAISGLTSFGISEAITPIKERRSIEKDVRVNRVIDDQLPVLPHGFAAKPVRGGIQLSVRGFCGIATHFVPQKEVDLRGLAALVQEQQEKFERESIVLRFVSRAQ